MKIILCEDEIAQQQWMEQAILEWQRDRKTKITLQIYGSGEELFFKKEEWVDADLLILDIELKEMNGMEIARKIREVDKEISLLFATGYEKYVFEGYEVGAISYIMKPVNKEKLFHSLDKAWENIKEGQDCLLLPCGEETKRVYIKDIFYIESDGHYCRILTQQGEIQVREKISALYEQLTGKHFYMCHRSYILNLAYVSRITKKDVILDSGEAIPLARGKWEEMNQQFMDYYRLCR